MKLKQLKLQSLQKYLKGTNTYLSQQLLKTAALCIGQNIKHSFAANPHVCYRSNQVYARVTLPFTLGHLCLRGGRRKDIFSH